MIDLIFGIGEILFLISYFFRDILYLRVMTIIGLISYIAGGVIAGISVEGMKAIIILNAAGILVNIYQIVKLLRDRMPILLPLELREIYSNVFTDMTCNEFLKIYRDATIEKHQLNEVLTTQDHPVERLMLIKSGVASIKKNDVVIGQLDKHYFIGEMSFLSNSDATATTIVTTPELECVAWNKKKLYELQKKDEALFIKLERVIALNLIKKLAR